MAQATQLLSLVRTAVAAAPQRADLKLLLAKALFRTGGLVELIERFGPEVATGGAEPELSYLVGAGALAANDDALAHDALRAAADGGYVPAWGQLAEVLGRLGRPDDALAAGLRGLELAPSDFTAFGIVARTLLERGERERVWALCAELRARGGCSACIPSAMAFAATTPQQRGEVAALIDEPRWLCAQRLDLPDDFNARLAAELLAHESLAPLPSTRATLGAGRRIDLLQRSAGPLARELLARIAAAVEVYAAQRPAAADHPMRERRPASTTLNAWAIAVHDDGHERWHLHPGGWISGVYYVDVPRLAHGGDGSASAHPGAIEFGPFPFGAERDAAAWPRRPVAPEAGMLLLFPSYFAHRTWPTGVPEARICVAFDVVSAETKDEP